MDTKTFDRLTRTFASANRRRLLGSVLSVALVGTSRTSVSAVVTFDPATRTGFVDSGTIRAVLGWDEQRLQEEVLALGFIVAETVSYAGRCSTGLDTSALSSVDMLIESDVQYEGPTVSGFTLTGRAQETYGQRTRPGVGATCVENNAVGTWLSVEEVSYESRLYIGYKGIQVLLWPGSGPGILRNYCQ